jgi:hypothetical protein
MACGDESTALGQGASAVFGGTAVGRSAEADSGGIVIQATDGCGNVVNKIDIRYNGCLHIRLGYTCKKISASDFFAALGL